MSRRRIIAGNWKMNKTPSEAVALVNELLPLVKNDDVDVVFCVPAIDIVPVVEAVKESDVNVGAENLYFEESGAYTGEISPNMLVDAGVKYVIIGHSERREYFAETDETVNKKVLKAFEHDLTPIICCGETLTQRKQGIYVDWIRMQIKIAFQNVTADQAKKQLLLMSQSGQSEPVRRQQQTRQKKYVQQFVLVSVRFMMRLPQMQFVFSTAVL